MPMEPLPRCEENEFFATDFAPHLSLPGFFPGAGGFFRDHADGKKRLLIFGTDFGPLGYQQGLAATGGEPASNRTIANLADILENAGIPYSDCFLTNSVLCVWRNDTFVGNHRIWRRYPDYVEACAAWHRGFIARHGPEAVVFMGVPPLLTFGRVLFPELGPHWAGCTSLKAVYAAERETFWVPGGPKVLLIPHASLWHLNSAKNPQMAAKAIEHLRAMA